jgi:hypothetical protein
MSQERSFNWTGVALIIVGLFLILRTVRGGTEEITLVDRILGGEPKKEREAKEKAQEQSEVEGPRSGPPAGPRRPVGRTPPRRRAPHVKRTH